LWPTMSKDSSWQGAPETMPFRWTLDHVPNLPTECHFASNTFCPPHVPGHVHGHTMPTMGSVVSEPTGVWVTKSTSTSMANCTLPPVSISGLTAVNILLDLPHSACHEVCTSHSIGPWLTTVKKMSSPMAFWKCRMPPDSLINVSVPVVSSR